MTKEQKIMIANLRDAGLGYKSIAAQMGIAESTVKSHCRRNGLAGKRKPDTSNIHCCRNCGGVVIQNTKRKEKKFCSDKCRYKWWNSHMDLVNRKALYVFECPYCKNTFTVYGNAHRKYCSHECYIKDRFGEYTEVEDGV